VTSFEFGFATAQIEPLRLDASSALANTYLLSPFVWQNGGSFNLLVRAVPRRDDPLKKVASIYYGKSADGTRFKLGDAPVLGPGPDEADKDGCEDPTVAMAGGTTYVYYTGWNESKKQAQLLLAAGPNVEELTKRGVALPSTQRCKNPKEATLVQVSDGSWRLFFEFALDGASAIGMAEGKGAQGPWIVRDPPFERRKGCWDSEHLSTGPVLCGDRRHPIMFYNGSTKKADWRIGWVAFDELCTTVVARCEHPVLAPPPPRHPGATDLAFAASAVETAQAVYLYYTVADEDTYRATFRASG
jgi:predicted GH43/DUF377 family glycosyl hydrolase